MPITSCDVHNSISNHEGHRATYGIGRREPEEPAQEEPWKGLGYDKFGLQSCARIWGEHVLWFLFTLTASLAQRILTEPSL